MPKVALNEQLIESYVLPAGKKKIELCCSIVSGFLLERRATSPRGGTFWYRHYRADGNKFVHLGCYPEVGLAEARAKAIQVKAEIARGEEPFQAPQKKAVPTFAEFAEQQYLPYARARKRSHKGDELRLRQRLIPRFGPRVMDSITKKELVAFHLELKELGLAGATCDHFIKLARHMYNLAIEWEVVKENPAAGVRLFNINNCRDDSLNEAELAQLMRTLQSHPLRNVCHVAQLLVATGMRLSEVLKSDWADVDLERRVWQVRPDNNKSKKAKPLPINDTAAEILESLESAKDRSGPLFVNHRTGERIKTIHKGWFKVRKAAGLPKLRLHGLRHTFCSMLVRRGVSIQAVSRLAGHASIAITAARYAHLDMQSLQTAATVADDALQQAMPKLLPKLLDEAPQSSAA